MSTSVGRVDLDLGINQKGLKQEIKGIGEKNKKEFQSLGKSLGNSFGGTFSVAIGNMIANLVQAAIKGMGNLLTSSIELGSSIAELENVTGTVFPNMTSQLESFSKSAIQQYGLTEMQAKKMMGTFGAMAQAFNYSEEAAYSMSESLTGLVGDVASFYNLDHDVAYTKIKSVFTGETESLKELGIVMTQTALDEFALQQGMGKTTKNMSEQEKVALRLAFVTDKLSFAAGDFSKTQHQWANQTRILSGQWDSFKAALGQGFIAVLTPVIRKLNELMAVVVKLGEKFRDFILTVTGHDVGTSGSGALIQEVSEATNAAADTAETASDKASSAAKEVKNSLLGFDKLNKLSAPDSGSGGSSGGISSLPSSSSVLPSESETEASANSMLGALDNIKKKLEEIFKWVGFDRLWEGIEKGVNSINFDSIKKDGKSIFNELGKIAKSAFDGIGKVTRSSMGFIGSILGGLVSTVSKMFEISISGFEKFLKTEGAAISKWIDDVSKTFARGFDKISIGAENIFGSIWKAMDDNQPLLEELVSNVTSLFTNMSMTVGTIVSDMFAGLSEGFANFTTEQKPLIEEFFSGVIESTSKMSNSVTDTIGGIFESVDNWWQNDGKRIWNEIVEVFFDITEWLTKIWNDSVKPVIDSVSDEIDRLWIEHIKPLWDNLLDFFTALWDFIKLVWDKIKPVVDWIVDTIGPAIGGVISSIIRWVGSLIGIIVDVVSGIIQALKGVLNFLTGVFTGDWKKAWGGIKDIFGGIFNGIWGIIKGVINMIIEGLNTLWSGLYGALRGIINGVGSIVKGIGDLMGLDWGWEIPKKAPQIPRLAEGGYVGANQPMLAMIGDNKRHGEIVAPEDKLYEIVTKALQAFMGQLIMALNSNNSNSQKANEMMQLIIQLGEETIVNRIIKMVNAESKRQGTAVIKV